MNKTYYVCKYTPLELIEAMGGEPLNLNDMPENFDLADQLVSPNLCGFSKALIQAVYEGNIHELVLVNCCDSIRAAFDILKDSGKLDFIYMLDMLHAGFGCSREKIATELEKFIEVYGTCTGTTFDEKKFRDAFRAPEKTLAPHIEVLGARMGQQLFDMVSEAMPMPVKNASCVHNRSVGAVKPPENFPDANASATTLSQVLETSQTDENKAAKNGSDNKQRIHALMDWYAGELLAQVPCMRMMDKTGRKQLYNDPSIKGIIYHTIKFCDFYSFEYADIKQNMSVPILKIESDYTVQSSGQLRTRLEAFAESFETEDELIKGKKMGKGYVAGIDSGSTSTDVVILDKERNMIAGIILPTGAGAGNSAEKALEEALTQTALTKEDIDAVVTTGYGRDAIKTGDKSITEITCHARGAHFLEPSVRTVIDIGGQDSKVIRMDEEGNVVNFVMNDKCAAGTGRFLEMMAHTLQMSLDDMSKHGLTWDEDISISSMCTVFAESEVVSLIAQNKKVDDIVHGLNKSVAVKTNALVKRVGGEEKYMMTGGVSKNEGLVKTLSKTVGSDIIIRPEAQLCGALGAALYAADMLQ